MAALRQTDRSGALAGLLLLEGPAELLIGTTLGKTVWINSDSVPEKARMSPGEDMTVLAPQDELIVSTSLVQDTSLPR